ncbi:MAG: DUF4340 domain-containing protein [Lachnospiraceae bacterium]|nr:DUF4340 domain-containing protein [Lachnospiraceae bacterium]
MKKKDKKNTEKNKSKANSSDSKSVQKKKKSKKGLITIIVSVLVIALLVVLLIVVNRMPTMGDNDTESTVSEFAEEYTLLNHAPSEIEEMTVENENGRFTVLSHTPTVQSTAEDGTVSEATEATEYTLVGYEDMKLKPAAPDALASDLANMTSNKIVDDGSKKSDFGLDNPRATATVKYKSGETVTVYLGADAPSDMGAYVMVEGMSNIYLVTAEAVDSFMYGAMDLITNEIGSSADTTENAVFTKMVFGGRLYGEDVVLENSTSDAYSESYVITSPDKTIANEETVSYMVNAVRNLTADKVLAIGLTEDELSRYGLDDPYVTVDAEYPDVSVSYRASEPDADGKVYLERDGIVYQISKGSLPWVTATYESMLPTNVLSPKLSAVSKVTVTAADKSYEFAVSNETTVTHDSDNDTDVESTETTIKCGNKDLDEGNFRVFYQNLTSAKRSEKAEVPTGKSAVLTVSYEYTDGTKDTAVYYEGENRKCTVVVNDNLASQTFETYVSTIIADVEKAANGEAVASIS